MTEILLKVALNAITLTPKYLTGHRNCVTLKEINYIQSLFVSTS
jgi:hypothetical protein